jgi:phosphoribosylaminoimidazole-succinocarboxamide synthase
MLHDVSKLSLLYAGKTKDVYELPNGNVLLQFTDKTTMNEKGEEDPGGNLVGKSVDGSGLACILMTKHFFKLFEEAGIPTHLVKVDVNDLQMEVQRVSTIGTEVCLEEGAGVEWIGRWIATGSFVKHYGKYIADGKQFSTPFVHATLKDDERGDPYIDEYTLQKLGILSSGNYQILKGYTEKIAEIMKSEFQKLGCVLYDFKVEYGVNQHGDLILIDEIGPGSARVYKNNIKMSKIEIGALFSI